MALSIGVKRGSLINIGGVRHGGTTVQTERGPRLKGYTLFGGEELTVIEVIRPDLIRVEYKGKQHDISEVERTKLDEDVYVSCGPWNGKGSADYSRLAFEAPRSIRIERLERIHPTE